MADAKPVAWIIEPAAGGNPYLTFKPDVAEKRASKGDHVTEYHSKNPNQNNNEDDDL